uniref:Uncharacterized protein n=1 Tax=Cebus imitator TaxID=2715852 RepID=A0A2K5SEI9_CEBIM
MFYLCKLNPSYLKITSGKSKQITPTYYPSHYDVKLTIVHLSTFSIEDFPLYFKCGRITTHMFLFSLRTIMVNAFYC